ncbi:hypothetical protein BD413DRAFT_465136 [Trametes elegans]|nr:hypothetical protein BD413DRAFT_465136 [Trametes elegans]
MPRHSSPPDLSPLQRTARWVEAQAEQAYDHPRPPSPRRASVHPSSSYRTTSSSDDSYPKSPVTTPYAMPAANVSQRPLYDARSRRASLPFPQSPPGSGYPLPLEVAAPRRAEPEEKKVSSARLVASPLEDNNSPQIPRPSLRKQRRPSLIEQLISFSAPSQRRREESGRRGQT